MRLAMNIYISDGGLTHRRKQIKKEFTNINMPLRHADVFLSMGMCSDCVSHYRHVENGYVAIHCIS
jgi:hypothetical protein